MELLTNKKKFVLREWKLEKKKTIDFFDILTSDIDIDFYQNIIMRVLPTYNELYNDNWITDKIRFGYDSLILNLRKDLYNLNILFISLKINNVKFF